MRSPSSTPASSSAWSTTSAVPGGAFAPLAGRSATGLPGGDDDDRPRGRLDAAPARAPRGPSRTCPTRRARRRAAAGCSSRRRRQATTSVSRPTKRSWCSGWKAVSPWYGQTSEARCTRPRARVGSWSRIGPFELGQLGARVESEVVAQGPAWRGPRHPAPRPGVRWRRGRERAAPTGARGRATRARGAGRRRGSRQRGRSRRPRRGGPPPPPLRSDSSRRTSSCPAGQSSRSGKGRPRHRASASS